MCSHVRYQEDLLHRVILLNLRYNQSINLHFLSLGLTRGVKQTITGKLLRMLYLDETSHSMLFWATRVRVLFQQQCCR